ncbi:hypothetical protein [Methylosinus sp. Sm6]|uniref:hypothetical protein n=1 Tax=Methylosinus sp. Sm6 TaxID=2866948 RepID=UPI001C995E51|nr:hypothetical protein [Methylosinus sp. Sm6]MBY6244174.1 hypothetical protein [Methylosinus sp. Sm6]
METTTAAGAKATAENPAPASKGKAEASAETRGFELPVNVIFRGDRHAIGSELDLTRDEFETLKKAGVFDRIEWKDGD